MIDLTDLRRIRFHRGTVVHRTQTTRWGLSSGCGKFFALEDLYGRQQDQPLPPETTITCKACLAAPNTEEN